MVWFAVCVISLVTLLLNTGFCLIVIYQESKLKYYNLMIQVDQHEGSYLSICKHYRAIYDTPCILEDSSKWQQVCESLMCGLVSAHSKRGGCRCKYTITTMNVDAIGVMWSHFYLGHFQFVFNFVVCQ